MEIVYLWLKDTESMSHNNVNLLPQVTIDGKDNIIYKCEPLRQAYKLFFSSY